MAKLPIAVFSGISILTIIAFLKYSSLSSRGTIGESKDSRILTVKDGDKRVFIFNNGNSSGGVEIGISEEEFVDSEHFAKYASGLVDIRIHKSDEVIVADRVYTGNGKLVRNFNDFETGDYLYTVAPGTHFIWPFVEIGHKVYLDVENSPDGKPVIIESFSESPRIFHIHNFFDDEDAEKLITHVSEIKDDLNKLQQSHVGHLAHKKVKSNVRTSENAFDQSSETALKLKKRSFDLLRIAKYDESMADGLQVLRYKQKQAYIAHEDYFAEDTDPIFNWSPYNGGSNRFATVFLYLSDVEKGGQTVFPQAEMPTNADPKYHHPQNQTASEEVLALFDKGTWQHDMVQQCETKLAAYPKKRHAILFYSQKPDGSLDPMSLHGGCPVLQGTKWAANLWVWNRKMFGHHEPAAEINVVFNNPTNKNLKLYWDSTFMTDLPAQSKRDYKTFDGHKWSIRDGDNIIVSYIASASDGTAQTVTVADVDGTADSSIVPDDDGTAQTGTMSGDISEFGTAEVPATDKEEL